MNGPWHSISIYLVSPIVPGLKKTDGRLYWEGWWWAIQGDHEFVGSTNASGHVIAEWRVESNFGWLAALGWISTPPWKGQAEFFSIIRTTVMVKRGISSLFSLILWTHQSQQIDVLACQNIRAGRYACQTESLSPNLGYAMLHTVQK